MAEAAPRPTLSDRLVALAHSRWLLPVLFLVQVAETTVLPLPYEAAFIALCLAARTRIWIFIAITVIGSAVLPSSSVDKSSLNGSGSSSLLPCWGARSVALLSMRSAQRISIRLLRGLALRSLQRPIQIALPSVGDLSSS